ncbi:hypothetical protein ABK040_013298 [Willaertia magna]
MKPHQQHILLISIALSFLFAFSLFSIFISLHNNNNNNNNNTQKQINYNPTIIDIDLNTGNIFSFYFILKNQIKNNLKNIYGFLIHFQLINITIPLQFIDFDLIENGEEYKNEYFGITKFGNNFIFNLTSNDLFGNLNFLDEYYKFSGNSSFLYKSLFYPNLEMENFDKLLFPKFIFENSILVNRTKLSLQNSLQQNSLQQNNLQQNNLQQQEIFKKNTILEDLKIDILNKKIDNITIVTFSSLENIEIILQNLQNLKLNDIYIFGGTLKYNYEHYLGNNITLTKNIFKNYNNKIKLFYKEFLMDTFINKETLNVFLKRCKNKGTIFYKMLKWCFEHFNNVINNPYMESFINRVIYSFIVNRLDLFNFQLSYFKLDERNLGKLLPATPLEENSFEINIVTAMETPVIDMLVDYCN